MLKLIVDFEVQSNKDPSWMFRNKGLAQLQDDFLLFNEYVGHYQTDQLDHMYRTWGKFILTEDDEHELLQVPDDTREDAKLRKFRDRFMPLWLFFVALCRALQQGENRLTATDAFWLGLIDEVIGYPDLPTLRIVSEEGQEPPPVQGTFPGPLFPKSND